MNICLPFPTPSRVRHLSVSRMEFTFGLLLVLPGCILGHGYKPTSYFKLRVNFDHFSMDGIEHEELVIYK